VDKYILKKVIPMSIENKKWQLVELNYQAVKGTAQTHYLILNSATQRLEAKACCNQMGGAYAIKKETELMIKQLMSTVMACENMQTEMDFYTALSTADNFSVFNNQLFLNKKMMSLARFDLVMP
jgi:heat shock protein HslJ